MEQKTLHNQRILWIDQLRAIAFFFVVLGHVALPKEVESLIYSFHMPIFFIISGLTLKHEKLEKINPKEFISKQFRNYIIPYLWIAFLMFPLWYVTFQVLSNSKTSIFDAFCRIFECKGNLLFTSNALWFLLVLFFANIIYMFCAKLAKGNQQIMLVLMILLALVGYAEKGIQQIWHFNIAFTAVPLMYLGNRFMAWYNNGGAERIKSTAVYKRIFYIILFIAIGCLSHTLNGRISMTANKFGKSLLLFYITAIFFSLAITLIVIHLPKLSLISYIGKNTLLYLGIHVPIIRLFEHAFPDIFSQYMYSILLALAVYFGLSVVCPIFNSLFPFVCGKPPKPRTVFTRSCKAFITFVCTCVPAAAVFKKLSLLDGTVSSALICSGILLLLCVAFVFVTERFFPVVWLEEKQKATTL